MTLVFLIEWSHFDLTFADWLYHLQGDEWRLKSHYITSGLLHEAGRKLIQIVGLFVLLLALTSHFNSRLAPYKRGLWFLFLSMALGPLFVSVLKALTHVDCPWDLQRYGGEHPYLPTFQAHPGNYDYGRCFPSGHSSGGYGLLGFYFFLRHYKPDWKWYGLSLGLLMGLIFGITQQLRGAHFLSHDLWSLAICWFSALFSYWLILGRQRDNTK